MINVLFYAVMPQWLWTADIWYSLPLIVSISLVYSATRHEDMGQILGQAIRLGVWIIVFMSLFFAILWMISR